MIQSNVISHPGREAPNPGRGRTGQAAGRRHPLQGLRQRQDVSRRGASSSGGDGRELAVQSVGSDGSGSDSSELVVSRQTTCSNAGNYRTVAAAAVVRSMHGINIVITSVVSSAYSISCAGVK